jgi:hypothetical protein
MWLSIAAPAAASSCRSRGWQKKARRWALLNRATLMLPQRGGAVMIGIGSSSSGQTSAWQTMEDNRVRRAAAISAGLAAANATSVALIRVHQNKITGTATLAAKAALQRIQAALKVKQNSAAQSASNQATSVRMASTKSLVVNTLA